MNLVLLTSALALCTPHVRCRLLLFPTNKIVNFGQGVEFECSTELTTPVNWDFAEINSTQFDYIYLNEEITGKFSSRYKVNKSTKGRWDLVIESVDLAHAGTYRCHNTPTYDNGATEMNVSAQLIIIDSNPLCATNASKHDLVEGDYIRMWCTVRYAGNWIPVMECTRNNGKTVVANIHYTFESSKVAPSLITQLASNDNGATFTCKMTVNPNTRNNRPAKGGEIQASNIPHYQHSWNFTADVLYGPKKQTIKLIDDEFKVGSRMECFAQGNPAPSYEWEIVGKNISLNEGSILVISKSMISDEEQKLRCTATNYVIGKLRKNETTFAFNLTDGTLYSPRTTTQANGNYHGTFETLLIIGISIGALLFGLVIAVVSCQIRRKEFRVVETSEAPVQPIYAVVKKERNDKKKTRPTFTISSPTERKPKQNYTGADGTQYVELNSIHDQKSNGVLVKQNPMFSLVETYASIDHTLAVPPPTPPPVPKRN